MKDEEKIGMERMSKTQRKRRKAHGMKAARRKCTLPFKSHMVANILNILMFNINEFIFF